VAVILILTERVKRWLNVKVPLRLSCRGLRRCLLWEWHGISASALSPVCPWYVAAIYAISFAISANIAYLAPLIKEAVRVVIDLISKKKKASCCLHSLCVFVWLFSRGVLIAGAPCFDLIRNC